MPASKPKPRGFCAVQGFRRSDESPMPASLSAFPGRSPPVETGSSKILAAPGSGFFSDLGQPPKRKGLNPQLTSQSHRTVPEASRRVLLLGRRGSGGRDRGGLDTLPGQAGIRFHVRRSFLQCGERYLACSTLQIRNNASGQNGPRDISDQEANDIKFSLSCAPSLCGFARSR